MELVLPLLLLVLAMIVVLSRVPLHRWTFEHHGHRVEIRNYALREVIAVDGIDQPDTRTRGNRLTEALHTVALPDGTRLRVWIGASGFGVGCRVDDGSRTVFQTGVGMPPVTTPQPASVDDPRLVAARVLLADIATVDPEAAATLTAALERMVQAELGARSVVDAHTALGGNVDDAADLLADRTHGLDELLSKLRALHLVVMGVRASDVDDALDDARDAVARVAARTEVEPQGRRADRARRASQREP